MPSQLAKLLGRHDIAFDIAISDLEKATGNRNIDVKLVGDVLAKAHSLIKSIGLDSHDLKASELYRALLAEKGHKSKPGNDYVGVLIGGRLVSLNHQDIDADRIHQLPFSKRSVKYMQLALTAEIIRRYQMANKTNPRNLEPIFKQIDK